MTKTTAWIALLILTAILGSASFCVPHYLSDAGNTFFKNFVNHELLSVLGVIVTITLASAANLHLEINKLQEKTGDKFAEARTAIRLCSYSLIAVFIVAALLVMVKPAIGQAETGTALINSAVILLLVFSVGVLADLTAAIFAIEPLPRTQTHHDEPAGSSREG